MKDEITTTYPELPAHHRFQTFLRLLILVLIVGGAASAATYLYLSPFIGSTTSPSVSFSHSITTSDKTGASGAVAYNQDIRKQDLSGAAKRQVTDPASGNVEIMYADLNDDKVEDALVQVKSNGSAGYLNQFVYTLVGGQLKLLWRNPDQLASSRGYLGDAQAVVLVGSASTSSINMDTTYVYKWNGSTFVRQ